MDKMNIPLLFMLACITVGINTENVTETEMFTLEIKPNMFNWTYQVFDKQYSYHASIFNKPDLPQWLHYIYSIRHQSGFIFGTPPIDQADLKIQIVGLNRENYETRQLIIPLNIVKKSKIAKYQVQVKIDNLNVEDMLDEYKMVQLKDIFRKNLWKESAGDLYTTFMISAIELGARFPLKPNEGEGVVLKLGSFKSHSSELLQLQKEVQPLFKKPFCPRDFKRTTVERLFRDVGFNLDWCSFRLIEIENADMPVSKNDKISVKNHTKLNFDSPSVIREQNWWMPPAKHEIPHRSYFNEFSFTIIAPMFVMIFLVSVLSMILCFHHEGMEDIESDYFFDTIFHICNDYVIHRRSARNIVSDSKVELSQYQSDGSGATDANPNSSAVNIHDCFSDNLSNKSNLGISPNNSLSKNPSPRSYPNTIIDYNRPQPPPYLGSNTNSLVMRHQNALDDELAVKRSQARALEESLQMLNDANIINPGYQLDDGPYCDKNPLGDDIFFSEDLDRHNSYDNYIPNKSNMGLSLRHSNGMTNGTANNGNVGKHHDGF